MRLWNWERKRSMFDTYEEVLTINDVCNALRISRGAVRNLIESGKLKAFRPGKRQWRVMKTELEAFISSRKIEIE